MKAASKRLLTIARPRFKVAGQEQPRMAQDLLRLDVHHDEDGLSTLELSLVNWDAREAGDAPSFTWFDGQILDFGKDLAVLAGDDDNAAEIFRGVITSFQADFDAHAPPKLVVRAEDRLQWLRMTQKSKAYTETTDADIARDVASDHSLGTDVDVDGPQHKQLLRINTSSVALLRERARAVDARIGLSVDANDQATVVFKPRRESGGDPAVALSRVAEIVAFEVNADLAHQRTAVEVHGWSVQDKSGIHERAGADAVSGEKGDGRSGPDVLGELSVEAVEHLHLEVPSTTDEARRIAQSLMRRRARGFVTGRLTTNGTPRLGVGCRVDVRDTGPWFDGEYHVEAVHHAFDQSDGLRTHLQVQRVGLGRPA